MTLDQVCKSLNGSNVDDQSSVVASCTKEGAACPLGCKFGSILGAAEVDKSIPLGSTLAEDLGHVCKVKDSRWEILIENPKQLASSQCWGDVLQDQSRCLCLQNLIRRDTVTLAFVAITASSSSKVENGKGTVEAEGPTVHTEIGLSKALAPMATFADDATGPGGNGSLQWDVEFALDLVVTTSKSGNCLL
eukprot:CAMPEP_0178390854 /NCGR_PEP_ID=MMETSP0689_2-20121128/10860_1 /TAXON_ID=160604 /ORGANISM="Amphidinium massartii, Strain CS-259" /LENGTH=190 /DNA_ID=CAMNT_0020011375 /DNA_START=318 /DNA_END=891 /DNA_ORIENTATION=+